MENIQKQLEDIKSLLNLSYVNTKDFLSVEETAQYLNVSKSHLYKLTSKKEIPFYCPTGKKIYFKRIEIENWISNSRTEAISDIESEVELYLSRNKSFQS